MLEAPSPTFFKINFDSSVISSKGDVGFIIKGPDTRFVAAGGGHLFGPSVSGAQL